jgi:hypothetical protein
MTAAVPLVERLARLLYANQAAQGEHFGTEGPWWDDARALLPVVEQAVAEALREAARDARSSPSTRVGDLHPGEVWAAWLDTRADAIATTEENKSE